MLRDAIKEILWSKINRNKYHVGEIERENEGDGGEKKKEKDSILMQFKILLHRDCALFYSVQCVHCTTLHNITHKNLNKIEKNTNKEMKQFTKFFPHLKCS